MVCPLYRPPHSMLPSLTTEGHSSWAACPQVRISLRRAAILAGAGAADGSDAADGGLPPIAEGSMKHSKSARSLAEALSSLEQVPLPAFCVSIANN
jgi:hypothetical protein